MIKLSGIDFQEVIDDNLEGHDPDIVQMSLQVEMEKISGAADLAQGIGSVVRRISSARSAAAAAPSAVSGELKGLIGKAKNSKAVRGVVDGYKAGRTGTTVEGVASARHHADRVKKMTDAMGVPEAGTLNRHFGISKDFKLSELSDAQKRNLLTVGGVGAVGTVAAATSLASRPTGPGQRSTVMYR